MSSSPEPYLGYFPEAELVVGIVCPLGTEYQKVLDTLSNFVGHFGYQPNIVKLSDYFDDLLQKLNLCKEAVGNDVADRMRGKIADGNKIRAATRNDILAMQAASAIASKRPVSNKNENNEVPQLPKPMKRVMHVIVSIKRPEEVETLRRIYGEGFYLIGIASTEEERRSYLKEKGVRDQRLVDSLIDTDAKEEVDYGQLTRDTFYLSDAFVSLQNYKEQVPRLLDLIFGCPFHTPSADEHAMYMAYAASFRSGDLARQVGAAIVDQYGDLLAVGCNEVPKVNGGQYWSGDGPYRDMDLEVDSNDQEKAEIAAKIMAILKPDLKGEERTARAKQVLKGTGFFDITEFGRSVHAEMEALLACGRTGRSTRSATLFTTTFPCHNCTRHIIAAGIVRVVYIEPYAKSKAFELHSDAVTSTAEKNKIPFEPFIGIGPRRYLDLFSLSLGTGYRVERKVDGKRADWTRTEAAPRLQMKPTSYIARELLAYRSLTNLLSSRASGTTA